MVCVKSEPWQRAFSQEVGPGQVCSDYFYPGSLSYLMSEEPVLAHQRWGRVSFLSLLMKNSSDNFILFLFCEQNVHLG